METENRGGDMGEKCLLCKKDLENERESTSAWGPHFYCADCDQVYWLLGGRGATGFFRGLGYCGNRDHYFGITDEERLHGKKSSVTDCRAGD